MQDSQQTLASRTLVITLTVAGTLIVIAFSLYFIFLVRAVILDLVIALVIAAALQPLVVLLEKKGLGKITASVISILATLLIVGVIVTAIAAPLINEATSLISDAPRIINNIAQNNVLADLNGKYHFIDSTSYTGGKIISSIAGQSLPVLGIIWGIVGGITSVVVILVFVFFILIDGPQAWKKLLDYFPTTHRSRIDATGNKMMRAISGFVSGNLFISLIAGTVSLITFLSFHVPYAFALAALVALLDLIPLIGTVLAAIIVALVALTQGIIVALIVVAILLTYQFIENHFIQPVVYSRSVKLAALLIVIATLVGAELAGVIGVLLAIPAAAVIQIAITDIFFPQDQIK